MEAASYRRDNLTAHLDALQLAAVGISIGLESKLAHKGMLGMTVFEMVFSLTGLVLSLSLVVVLMGLGKALQPRPGVTIGWLTPLLGVFVLGDIATFWGMAWELRDLMPSVWPSLGVGLVLTSTYYLAASLVFPDDFEKEPDLDAYYLANKRMVLGLILACNLSAFAIGHGLGRVWSPSAIVLNSVYVGGLLTAIFVKGRSINITALIFLIALLVWSFSDP